MTRYWSLPMLRITACSDPLLWYADQIGQLVPYEGDDGQYGFRSREPSGYVNFVKREDAQPTKVRVHTIHRQRWPFNSRQAKAVVELNRQRCGALCDEMGVCQGLKACRMLASARQRPHTTGQSRRHSAMEAAVNIGVGFVVSLAITALVMPLFGHHVTASQNLAITSIFTVASLARSYALRRFFNHLHTKTP